MRRWTYLFLSLLMAGVSVAAVLVGLVLQGAMSSVVTLFLVLATVREWRR